MTEKIWAMSPMKCSFRAKKVCTNFRWGLVHRRRTGVEPLKLVIFHFMQSHFADVVRCVALYIIM